MEIASGRSNLGLDTIDAHTEYEKMQSSIIFGILQALSWLIFLFGVVNLINMAWRQSCQSGWCAGRKSNPW